MSFDLYLASSSPRRSELLTQIGVQYRIVKIDVPEVPGPNEEPEVFAMRLAIDKARAGWDSLDETARKPVLGADTVVVIDGEILGKPRDQTHGLAMLAKLSGRTHEVITAVALMDGEIHTCLSCSQVSFAEMTNEERVSYWQTVEPEDKAGGYAIQGLAAKFIRHLSGSYSGVMGLPLYETAGLLKDAGITV